MRAYLVCYACFQSLKQGRLACKEWRFCLIFSNQQAMRKYPSSRQKYLHFTLPMLWHAVCCESTFWPDTCLEEWQTKLFPYAKQHQKVLIIAAMICRKESFRGEIELAMEASADDESEARLDTQTLHWPLIWQLHFHLHGRRAFEGYSILLAVGLVRSSRCPVHCRT